MDIVEACRRRMLQPCHGFQLSIGLLVYKLGFTQLVYYLPTEDTSDLEKSERPLVTAVPEGSPC